MINSLFKIGVDGSWEYINNFYFCKNNVVVLNSLYNIEKRIKLLLLLI